MSIQTSTGVKIYISTQLPATFDLAGYGALTWTEIKEVTNIVPPSPSYQVVTHEPLKSGITQKNKGFVDYGDPTIDYALDTSDTGQQMLQSAASGATKNLEHSFKLTYPNGDIRYFSGRVFSSLEGGFSANSMVSGTSNVGVSRAVVKIPAISFAANYVTNTYSILGESKTFADAHTFTRSTTATFVGSNGLIQSAAIDAPRFTYDPVTLAPKGLLIEGSRTNLLTYSEEFDNAVWVKGDATVTPNALAAPDGTLTMDKLVEGVANSSHSALEVVVSAAIGTYTLSVIAKAGERSSLQLAQTITESFTANFNLALGTVTGTSGGAIGRIEPLGSGFYKCVMTYTTTSVHNIASVVYLSNGVSVSYQGDGTSGIYIWGAQLEAGSFASSYIPTTTAQVTRTADICTAKEFTSWYNQGEGSVYSNFIVSGDDPAAGQYLFSTDTSPLSSSKLWIEKLNSNDKLRFASYSVAYGATLFSAEGKVVTIGDSIKVAASTRKSSGSSQSLSIDQDAVVTGASAAQQVDYAEFRIGARSSTGNFLNGTIAQLNYYPTALSDEALQDLTR